MEEYTVEYQLKQIDGDLYCLPNYASHRPAVVALANGRMYEPETHLLIQKIQQHRPGSMVHAGTFFGDMLPSFSRACVHSVYAFEPVLENFVLAKLCVEKNNLENVFLFNSALGKNVGMVRVDTGAGKPRHYGGSSRVSLVGQITTLVTIDSFCIENLSIIQLDVEGFELDALLGAVKSIRKHAPLILIEDNKNNCSGFLQRFGYDLLGQVPGLKVWAHKDREDDKKILC